MSNEDLQQIQTLVASSRKVLVLTHKNPSIDTMASSLALFLAFQKMGKDVTIAMEEPPLVAIANLVGIDKVQTSLPGKNLMLTYKPYNLGDFEKVTCLENPSPPADSFTLTVIAKDGVTPDSKNFSFNFVGATADLIITVEILDPAGAGKLYDPALFSQAPVINIDNHDPNKDFGKFNLVEPEAASLSEIVTFFLRAVNAQLDQDMAKNLYDGIVSASNNFQSPKVAAATFEAAAICLRAGAKGLPAQPVAQPVSPQPAKPANGSAVPHDWTQPKIYRGTRGTSTA